MKRSGATLTGQLLITFTIAGALGVLACIYQTATLHGLFPGGFITYGEFLNPGKAHLRNLAITVPLAVVSATFLLTGILSSWALTRVGARWLVLLFWLFLTVAFLPFLAYNFISSVQGDASVFI